MSSHGDGRTPGSTVSDGIVAEFTLTQEEFVSVVSMNRRRRVTLAVIGLVGLVSSLFGAMIVGLPRGRHMGEALLIIGVYELAIAARGAWWAPTRAWRKSRLLHGRRTMVFTEGGVETRSALAEARFRWEVFGESRESRGLYLLGVSGRRGYAIVPRRAFRSVSDEIAFRQLLVRHTRSELRVG
jgi:YcxB-like protein